MAYFYKVIRENLGKVKNVIKRLSKRNDAIGQWLTKNRQHTNSLHKLAHTWALDHANEQKQDFVFKSFMEDDKALEQAYEAYLKEFPDIFKTHLHAGSKLVLERDYAAYKAHELEVLKTP